MALEAVSLSVVSNPKVESDGSASDWESHRSLIERLEYWLLRLQWRVGCPVHWLAITSRRLEPWVGKACVLSKEVEADGSRLVAVNRYTC